MADEKIISQPIITDSGEKRPNVDQLLADVTKHAELNHLELNEEGKLFAASGNRPATYDPTEVVEALVETYTKATGVEPSQEVRHIIAMGVMGKDAQGNPQSLQDFGKVLLHKTNQELVKQLAVNATPQQQAIVADSLTAIGKTATPSMVQFGAALTSSTPETAVKLAQSQLRKSDNIFEGRLAAEVMLRRGDMQPHHFEQVGGRLVADNAAKVKSTDNVNTFMRGNNAASGFNGNYVRNGIGAQHIQNAIQQGIAAGNGDPAKIGSEDAKALSQNPPQVLQNFLGTLNQSALNALPRNVKEVPHQAAKAVAQFAQNDAMILRALNPTLTSHVSPNASKALLDKASNAMQGIANEGVDLKKTAVKLLPKEEADVYRAEQANPGSQDPAKVISVQQKVDAAVEAMSEAQPQLISSFQQAAKQGQVIQKSVGAGAHVEAPGAKKTGVQIGSRMGRGSA